MLRTKGKWGCWPGSEGAACALLGSEGAAPPPGAHLLLTPVHCLPLYLARWQHMQGLGAWWWSGLLIRSICPHPQPHALQVVRAQSTEGLSLVSNIVELLCYTIIVAYNLNHVSGRVEGSRGAHAWPVPRLCTVHPLTQAQLGLAVGRGQWS